MNKKKERINVAHRPMPTFAGGGFFSALVVTAFLFFVIVKSSSPPRCAFILRPKKKPKVSLPRFPFLDLLPRIFSLLPFLATLSMPYPSSIMSVHTSSNRPSHSVTTAIAPHPRRVTSSPVLFDRRQALKTIPIVPYPTTLAPVFDPSAYGTPPLPCPSPFILPALSPTRRSYLSASHITANLQKLVAGQSSQKHPSLPSSTFTTSEMSLSSGSLATCSLTIEQVYWCMDCCYKEIQNRCKCALLRFMYSLLLTFKQIVPLTYCYPNQCSFFTNSRYIRRIDRDSTRNSGWYLQSSEDHPHTSSTHGTNTI